MKELISEAKAIISNQQGFAITLLFLILLPVIFFVLISTIEMTNLVQAGDMDMQEGLVIATKAAAEQVDMVQHAQGKFVVQPTQAITTFKKTLARNMGLNGITLQPTTAAYDSAPTFFVLVYNGSTTGSTANKLYAFNGNTLSYSTFATTGFPKSFVLDENGIYNGSGTGSITLKEPGVIAVMTIGQTNLLGEGERKLTRWAAARIESKKE